MTTNTVTYASRDRVATITLNRPEARNRINDAMVDGLNAAWRRLMESDDRVAVLCSATPEAFTVGGDLKDIPHDLHRGIPGVGVGVDKPVICAVGGWCVGGGMVLTTMCDLLVVAESAKFIYPEVKVGFSGGLISNLAARIPHKIAMELLLVGEAIDAQRAYEVGYANRVVPDGEEIATAQEIAGKIAATAPLPSRMLKRFVAETTPKGPSERAGIARRDLDLVNGSEDSEEGRAAFFEKRPQDFKGR